MVALSGILLAVIKIMDIRFEGPIIDPKSSQVCAPILRALPNWFGIEAAVLHYLQTAAISPTLFALDGVAAVGFLTIRQHSPYAAEIYVMGVLPQYHRQGIGRELVQRAEAWLREAGVEYLQVKTLAPTHPDPGYAKTRAFYESMGFRPVEIFPDLWGGDNPCLMLVKSIKA